MKVQLKPHQLENVTFAEKNKYVLIADEMGLGKTFSALEVVRKNELYPCIVICPKSLKTNWYREIKRMDHYKKVDIVKNSKHEIEQKNGKFAKDYTIVNYDLHKTILDYPNAKSIILDEIHYLKNYKAKRTIGIQNYIHNNIATHVIGLSGTPILNKGVEIISVVNTLHPNLIDFWQFINKYCYHGDWGGYFVRPDKVHEINEQLKNDGIMIRHTKDILDLPPKIRNYKVFTQPKGYRKEIDRLHEIYGKISVGALQKLRQWVAIKKTDDIVTYVNDIIEQKDDNKVIVFCNYIEPTNIIAKKLNVLPHTSELTRPEDRQDIIDKFTNNENEKVLCMSIRTGNVGLNLTQANHIVFCDFSYSPSDMLQAEDRAHRIGQEKTVNIHYLSAENTIDEQAIDLLTKKTKILNGVIDGKPYQYDHTDEENIESSIISELNKMFTEFGQVK